MKPPAICTLITLSIAAFTLSAQARSTQTPAKPPAKVSPDAVLAPSYILLDPASGRILEQRNAQTRMFPASTTKTMTALVAIESGKLDEVFTIGPNPPKTGEQSIHLLQGERFKLRDLVRSAMIKSANDACVAIAEAVAGDVPTFARMMNQKAKELGALNTNFVNPHGLHHANHYSSAYDLALIARAAMRHPEFNEMVRTQRSQVHGNWKIGPVRPLLNRNRLLFRWAECDGVKTGYTKQAGRCLIASATRLDTATGEPWRLLSVVLRSPNTWQDSQVLLARRGFAQFLPYLAARSGEDFGPAQVKDGLTSTEAVLKRDALLTLRAGEQSTLRSEVKMRDVIAPVRAGQPVGTLTYFAHDRAVAVLPLVARSDVPLSMMARVLPATMIPLSLPGGRLMIPTVLLGLMTLGGLKYSHEKRQRTAARRKTRRVASTPGPDFQTGESGARQRLHAKNSLEGRARSAPASTRKPGSTQQKSGRPRQSESDDRKPCLGEQFIARHLAEEAEERDFATDPRFEPTTGPERASSRPRRWK